LCRNEHLSRSATIVNTRDFEIALRPAKAADALRLGVLATQVFLDTYAFTGITEDVATEVREAFSTEAFDRILSTASTFITVAVQDGALVGFSQTTVGTGQSLAPQGKQAELDRLYVQEPFTNQGVGSRLLRAHEALAAKHGATVLWLSPWVGNDRALRFYAKHSYEDYGLVFFYMGQHKVENRVYAKRLPIAA
jgi:ribosomal protein S18 acetylase RimI-like enzyme